ncbi:MAG TPA: MFS transporter [Candidatus Dormibacteraeota bacterium]
MADFNYEMALAVLPLFLTIGLGAPAFAVGLVEGLADGSSAAVRLASGWFSDRIAWRKQVAIAGYSTTVAGFASMAAIGVWPLVIAARALAWMGRGLRQPIRSSFISGSVPRADLGKAFGFHEALDTLGALAGPAVAFALLATGHGFRTVFLAALVPGALCVLMFALLTRDPRAAVPARGERLDPLPTRFWRLLIAVAVFGAGNFAPAFFTLRAAEMLRPELSATAAASAAVLFYLSHNAVAAASSFPGGWLADRLGKHLVLAFAYFGFAAACLIGWWGHGPLAVAALALPVGISAPLVIATEQSLTSALVPERVVGTAFGWLGAVNGVGDLVSSVVVGVLWSSAGPGAGLGFGALLCAAGAVLLLVLMRGTDLEPAGQVLG